MRDKIIKRFLFWVYVFCIIYIVIKLIPHASFEDIKNLGLNTVYKVETNNVLTNLENITYSRLLYEFKEQENDLLSKTIQLKVDNDDIQLNLSNYVSIKDYLVNDVSFSLFQKQIHFVKNGEVRYNVDIISEFDSGKFKDDIYSIVNNYNIKMKEPKVKLVNGIMTLVESGIEGRKVNEDLLNSNIENIIKDYTNLIDNNINIVFDTIEVSPSESDLLAINTKVSTFSTGYSSSGASRKQNIAVASKHLNGIILSPGEILSVDVGIGSRNAANGYAKAGSYLNGKTVQTYGGGVCQVSTTLYGAVLRAGLVPVERNAHSMAVSYVPLGLDAAISEGYKDLKIQNTYSTPIYIEAIANGSTLTFNIYGKKDLLQGYTYEPKSKANGLKATAWLNKIKDGQIVETIGLNSSSYRPHS